jgi:signal peptidase I
MPAVVIPFWWYWAIVWLFCVVLVSMLLAYSITRGSPAQAGRGQLVERFDSRPQLMVVGEGSSMQPTLYTGQHMIVSPLSYMFGEPQRGDVVVFHQPENQVLAIKRIVGLPGDVLQVYQGHLYVNNQLIEGAPIYEPTANSGVWTVALGSYFVMGDNRNHSYDSLHYGPVAANLIVGKVRWILS